MDATEYADIEADIVRDLTEYFVRENTWDGDGWDDINAHVNAHWDEYFDGVPESDLVEHAAPDTFDPSDWAGQQVLALRPSDMWNIAFGAVIESVHSTIRNLEADIGAACHIHAALDLLADEEYAVDGAPNPSEVVHAFYTWLGEQDAAGDAFAHEANDRIGLQDFNETHVRRLTPLDVFGDADSDDYESLTNADNIVVDALWEWLNDQHPDYL